MKFYNPFKPHLVYFHQQKKYAIRKYQILFGWEFKDLTNDYNNFWWTRQCRFFEDCLSDIKPSIEDVIKNSNGVHIDS